MAQTFANIEIMWTTRECIVDEDLGYFHCWEHYADVIAPGLTIGSQQGGQFSRVYGIVEFTDGVRRVDPWKIKFTDEEHKVLSLKNEIFKSGGGYYVSPEELKQAISTTDTKRRV